LHSRANLHDVIGQWPVHFLEPVWHAARDDDDVAFRKSSSFATINPFPADLAGSSLFGIYDRPAGYERGAAFLHVHDVGLVTMYLSLPGLHTTTRVHLAVHRFTAAEERLALGERSRDAVPIEIRDLSGSRRRFGHRGRASGERTGSGERDFLVLLCT